MSGHPGNPFTCRRYRAPRRHKARWSIFSGRVSRARFARLLVEARSLAGCSPRYEAAVREHAAAEAERLPASVWVGRIAIRHGRLGATAYLVSRSTFVFPSMPAEILP